MNNHAGKLIIAIPADTHCGSTVGLIKPELWELAGGGAYIPNEVQTLLWKQWETAWEVVAEKRKGGRLIVVHAGDATEGIHHDATQFISPMIDEHQRIHISAMRWALERTEFDSERGDLLYYVTGSGAHVAPGSASEEAIARALSAVPNRPPSDPSGEDGRFVWGHLKIKHNGILTDIAHHGPPAGRRAWLKGNNLMLGLKSLYFNCLDLGLEIPRYYVRAHRHTYDHQYHEGLRGATDGFLLPCFQGMTEYGYVVAVDSLCNIGMLIITIEENGETDWTCPRIRVIPDEVQEV